MSGTSGFGCFMPRKNNFASERRVRNEPIARISDSGSNHEYTPPAQITTLSASDTPGTTPLIAGPVRCGGLPDSPKGTIPSSDWVVGSLSYNVGVNRPSAARWPSQKCRCRSDAHRKKSPRSSWLFSTVVTASRSRARFSSVSSLPCSSSSRCIGSYMSQTTILADDAFFSSLIISSAWPCNTTTSAHATCAGRSRGRAFSMANGASGGTHSGFVVTSRTWCSPDSTSAMCHARIAGPAIRSEIASPVITRTLRGLPNTSSSASTSTRMSCAAR